MAIPSLSTPTATRRLALASLVANCAIVVTGGAVRLTGSGLGCPDWPSCTRTTFAPTAALGIHGLIEWTNRRLTFVLTLVVVLTLAAVVRQQPRRPRLTRPATLLLLGIPAQAILGGVTVLTGLNPWSVMAHFLLSMLLICVAVVLHRRAWEGDGPPQPTAPAALRSLTAGVLALVGVVLALGTVVTGSGPHAGDPTAGRTGLAPAAVSQLHADAVMLLIGVTLALWVALRSVGSPAAGATGLLLSAELGQGLIGFVQYFTGLPVLLVGLHLAGACLVLVAAVRALLAQRSRPAPQPPQPMPAMRRHTAPAKRSAEPGAWRRNSEGSVSSSSSTTGAPVGPGTTSTRA